MAASLMTKFNEITADEFDYLVLESVEFDISAETVRVNIIYPELKEQIERQIVVRKARSGGSRAEIV